MERIFNGLPSKKEYVEGVVSFLKQNNYAFEEEVDNDSPTIGMLYDSEEMFQLSYETDELAPYLAVGKLVAFSSEEMEKDYSRLLEIANAVNNELIVTKVQVIKEYGVYFYVAVAFPFLQDLGSFIGYSIDAIEKANEHYMTYFNSKM